MRLWPFRTRAQARELAYRAGYTDARVDAAVRAAAGSAAERDATAAAEFAAVTWARALATADVSPAVSRTAPLSPAVLAAVGRDLVARGESVWSVSIEGGRPALTRACGYEIRGSSPRRDDWRYVLELAAPDGVRRRVGVPSLAVFHAVWSTDPGRPWRGVGPLRRANLAADLAAAVESRLCGEAEGPSGYVLPIPKDGQDATVSGLRQDLGSLDGGLSVVETTGNWDAGTMRVPREYEPRRIGIEPPEALVRLRSAVGREVIAAAGVPPQLFEPAGTAGGQREAYRRFLHAQVAPLGRELAAEAARALSVPALAFSWAALGAADVTGRARAFRSLTEGEKGLEAAEARRLVGL